MNLGAVLIIALTNDGFWLSGRIETVEVQWAVEQPPSDAVIVWRLVCGEARLASGRVVLTGEHHAASIHLAVPVVRTRTAMRLIYRVEQAGKPKPIAEGVAAVEVYPDTLLDSVAKRLTSRYLLVWNQPEDLAKHLFVWDRPEALPSLLRQAGIEHTLIPNAEGLAFVSPDVVIVGDDCLGADVDEQQKLLDLAASGANVLVLHQTKPAALAGYPLVRRAAPAKLAWQQEHPLAAALQRFDSLSGVKDLWAARLPSDEPALEIAWWPREVAGKQPVPIDAMVVSKSVGRGRLVLCQIPLGSWQRDPRSQLFLVDALDYLASPIVPTPPPSHRPRHAEPASSRPDSELVLP